MKNYALIALLFLTSCAAQTEQIPGDTPGPDSGTWGQDAAPDSPLVPDSGAAPDAGTGAEGGQDAPGQDGLGPDAGAPDGRIDVAAPDAPATVDAGTDARGDVGSDAAPDVRADSAPDARDAQADTGAVDSGLVPICTVAYPACQHAIEVDAQIQAIFPQACSPEYTRKCGGVGTPGSVVEVLPILCYQGHWRLSGGMSGDQWIPGHECTMPNCNVIGKICDP